MPCGVCMFPRESAAFLFNGPWVYDTLERKGSYLTDDPESYCMPMADFS